MFWSQSSVSSSHLETLLNKEDVTLQELMDEDEVLQECKSQNKRLIEYLIRSDVLEELVTLTTVEPPLDCDDNVRYKYPNIACELLTCEVPQLNHSLAKDEALLSKLYSFLESPPPLNPLLASFFSKTFSGLIARTSDQNWYSYQFTCLQVLEFLKSKENSVGLLLKHLGTSAIMDLLFKLITKVEGVEMKLNILNWLDEQQLVEKIVALLDPSEDPDIHYNASELLCNVIRTARENCRQSTVKPEEDSILQKLESPEIVNQLLDQMLKEPKSETSIVGGISVLLTLMGTMWKAPSRVGCNVYGSVEDVSEIPIMDVAISTVQVILPRLEAFHGILLEPPVKPAMRTTTCVLDPPLGQTRVEVTKLMSQLMLTRMPEVLDAVARLGTVSVMLDLFLRYSWNNFLHTEVYHCLAHTLTGVNATSPIEDSFPAHILVTCRLLERILDAWEENDTLQQTEKKPRRGYMGHLIKISNHIVEEGRNEIGAVIKSCVAEETITRWEEFVSTTLESINTKQSGCLGGGLESGSEDNVYTKGFTFPENNSLEEECYTTYQQLQTLAPAFAEQFGSFHEEQFNDNDDVLNSSSMEPRLEKLTFSVNNDDLDQQVAMFKQVCAQKLHTLDCDDSDLWTTHREHNQAENNASNEWRDTGNNSSSDEDNEAEEEETERSGPEGSEGAEGGEWSSSQGGVGDKLQPVPPAPPTPPVTDANPWGDAPCDEPSATNMDWAVFDNPDLNSVIASFVAGIGTDVDTCSGLDLTPSDGNVSVTEMFEERPVCVDQVEIATVCQVLSSGSVVQVTPDRLMESLETEPQDQTSTDSELLDNFRFLSTQGLITNNQSAVPPEIDDSVDSDASTLYVTSDPPTEIASFPHVVPTQLSLPLNVESTDVVLPPHVVPTEVASVESTNVTVPPQVEPTVVASPPPVESTEVALPPHEQSTDIASPPHVQSPEVAAVPVEEEKELVVPPAEPVLSTQGSVSTDTTTQSEDRGDSCLIPKENVQLVPNESTHTSNVNHEDATSANGPV